MCRFTMAWAGQCKEPGDPFCKEHNLLKCVSCGAQATHDCSHTGQFVCGAPLCDNCVGGTDASREPGAWGFMNHIHMEKPKSASLTVLHETGATSTITFKDGPGSGKIHGINGGLDWRHPSDPPEEGAFVLIATDMPGYEVARLYSLHGAQGPSWELSGYHPDGVERWLPYAAARAWAYINPPNF